MATPSTSVIGCFFFQIAQLLFQNKRKAAEKNGGGNPNGEQGGCNPRAGIALKEARFSSCAIFLFLLSLQVDKPPHGKIGDDAVGFIDTTKLPSD